VVAGSSLTRRRIPKGASAAGVAGTLVAALPALELGYAEPAPRDAEGSAHRAATDSAPPKPARQWENCHS